MTVGRLPRVSVAIITYEQRELLRECLESVLAQDYPELQVVVADDGSADGTHEMLQEFATAHPGVMTLRLSDVNRGITANSNAALEACDGKYIAWMGGDDLMLPDKLHAQVRFLEDRPEHVICYHDLDVFDSATGRTLRHHNSGPGGLTPLEGGAELLVEHGTFLGACSVMTRRSACPGHGFDVRIPIASDWLFWIETASKGRIGYLPKVLGRYRRHDNNVTGVSRDASEQFMTLGIVEVRYPQYLRAVRRGRAQRYYTLAAQRLAAGERRAGARYAAAAVRQGPLAAHVLRHLQRRRD